MQRENDQGRWNCTIYDHVAGALDSVSKIQTLQISHSSAFPKNENVPSIPKETKGRFKVEDYRALRNEVFDRGMLIESSDPLAAKPYSGE
jgi:hypothetical protein